MIVRHPFTPIDGLAAAELNRYPSDMLYSRRTAVLRTLSGIMILAIPVLLFGEMLGPSSADIRIDTGDLRYRYFGIPVVYRRMPEPYRSGLLAFGRDQDLLRPDWVQCEDFPFGGSGKDYARMFQGFYVKLVPWIGEHRGVARALARDIVRSIKIRKLGLPRGSYLLDWLTRRGTQGTLRVRSGWRDDPEVQAYLNSSGIEL